LPVREQQYVKVHPEDTLAVAFAKRVALSPLAVAYREYDAREKLWQAYSWAETAEQVGRVRAALEAEGLVPGDRVAIMLKNSRHWIWFDQGAAAAGLVTVPLYVDDRPDNIAYCLNDAGVKLLVVEGSEALKRLDTVRDGMPGVVRIVTVKRHDGPADERVRNLGDWLPERGSTAPPAGVPANGLATIVYTSGTTGRPKGVMLSHQNMLQNARAGLEAFDVYTDDVFLSFLPLSHMFERTGGYYLTMLAGAEVAPTTSATCARP
jgi:long-chain acyl-CoA synthetase